MSTLDTIFGAMLIFFVVRGFFRGLFRELISIASIFLAFFLANKFYPKAAPFFDFVSKTESTRQMVTYIAIFLLTGLVVWIVSAAFKDKLKFKTHLGFDHLGGLVFGLIKGVILCTMLLLVLTTFILDPEFIRNSRLAPYFAKGSTKLAQMIPAEMRATLESSKIDLEELTTFVDEKREERQSRQP